MPVHIDESIRKSPELTSVVGQSISFLEELSKNHIDEITADWKAAQSENGYPAIDLTLSDSEGVVSLRLDLDQLKDTDFRERRLNRLYDDLLDIGLRKIAARIRANLKQAQQEQGCRE